jgi:hypothetical protein
VALAALSGSAFGGAAAQSQVLAWGNNGSGQCNVPNPPVGVSVVDVEAGDQYGVARCSDGSLLAWGSNFHGQCNVPTLPAGVTFASVAAGSNHTAACLSDGSIIAWGQNNWGQCSLPGPQPGVTYVEVAVGIAFTYARRSDGSIQAWGLNTFGQCNVPALPPGLSYVEVDASFQGGLARRSDGTIVTWGSALQMPSVPPGLSCVAIEASNSHALALLSDGLVMAGGDNIHGQCIVPPLPPGLCYTGIRAGDGHSLAWRSDGSVVAWGYDQFGLSSIPAVPPGFEFADLAAGTFFSLALLTPQDGIAGRVLVVSPTASPGVDFTNVQHAIDAADEGDTLLLRTGSYDSSPAPAFTIERKGLTLVADQDATVLLTSPLRVQYLSTCQQLCLRGFDVAPSASPSFGEAVDFRGCSGNVWIEDCEFTAPANGLFAPVGPGLHFEDCAQVNLARCTLTGASSYFGLMAGLPGLQSTHSSVSLFECICNGGSGSSGFSQADGGDGVAIRGGFLYASGCVFRGGKGGPGLNNAGPSQPCSNGAAGGHGLNMIAEAPTVSTLACSFQPGAGGIAGVGAPGCASGSNGLGVQTSSGSYTLLAGSSHALTCSATCREGQAFTLTFQGQPGELAFLEFSGQQGFFYFPDFHGVLALDFPILTSFQGTLPASGTLVKSSGVITDIGVATQGITLYLQSAFYSAATGIYQATPSATVLLDASL